MDRRSFLRAVAAGLTIAPLAAEAQPAGTAPRVRWLSPTTPEFVTVGGLTSCGPSIREYYRPAVTCVEMNARILVNEAQLP